MNARKILNTSDSATRVLIALTPEEVEATVWTLREAAGLWGTPDASALRTIAERIERQINPTSAS